MRTVIKLPAAFFLVCCLCLSCTKDKSPEKLLPNSHTVFTAVPTWYAVTPAGLAGITSPAAAGAVSLRPWTEAFCITDAGCSGTSTFFLINKVGVAEFKRLRNDGGSVLHMRKWDQRFNSATAASIDMFNGTPVVRLYRNSFFNSENSTTDSFPAFLQWDRTNNLITPLSGNSTALIPDGYQITALEKTAAGYAALFKQTNDRKISFIYRAIIPDAATSADGYIKSYNITDISAEEYKNCITPRSFSEAPESLQTLLSYLKNVPFKLTVAAVKNKAVGLESERDGTYLNGAGIEDSADMPEGFAVAAETYNAALFSDGTFYYSYGAAPPVAAKLPLPLKNMVYRKFSISGTTLFAVWEESVFYEIGKAGLLQIDLQNPAMQ